MADLFANELAEAQILSLVLLPVPETLQEIISTLQPDDFALQNHQRIFQAAKDLFAAKNSIDVTMISDQLSRAYDSGTADELQQEIAKIMPCSDFSTKYKVSEYLRIIKNAALRRRVFQIVDSAAKELSVSPNDTSLILEKVRQELRDVVSTKHTWMPISCLLQNTYTALERRSSGEDPAIPTGIASLDSRILGGLFKGELMLIGARPAVGKSALGMFIALSAAAKGYKVGICSREMTDIQYGVRILSRYSEVGNSHMRSANFSKEEWQELADVIGPASRLPIQFIFSAKYVEDLRLEVQRLADEGRIDLLVVDYEQLMQSRLRFDKEYLRIGYVSKMLKDMATDLNISVVALCQVGRSTEQTMPSLADLRGSGDLEQDADCVMFMHRPKSPDDEWVNPKYRHLFDSLESRGLHLIVLNIAKNRQGDLGLATVVFDPSHMTYVSPAELQ